MNSKRKSGRSRVAVTKSAPPASKKLEKQIKSVELKKLRLEVDQMAVDLDTSKLELDKARRETAEAAARRRADTYVFDESVTIHSVRKCRAWLKQFSNSTDSRLKASMVGLVGRA